MRCKNKFKMFFTDFCYLLMNFRIVSMIAYTEGGLCFFLAATLLAVALAMERIPTGQSLTSSWLLAGLLAGSGMACKYTGLVQVVIPAAAALAISIALANRAQREKAANAVGVSLVRCLLVFGVGVALTVGPWLLKNAVETGNPIYPLHRRLDTRLED